MEDLYEEKVTQLRPHKWTSWGIEIYTREREGKTEYAYIIETHKWAWIGIEGDYTLVPVDQHPLLAPLFADPDDTTEICFVIDGASFDEKGDGGNIDIEFLEQQHLITEYATLAEQDENEAFNERERLYEMGFGKEKTGEHFRHVIRFNHRKLGE